MAFEPNWNDSQLLKHHSVINGALSPPMGDVKYSWALWSWLGNVAVHRSIFSPLCLQHMFIVSFVFFLCLRGLLCFIHKKNHPSLFSVLSLVCFSCCFLSLYPRWELRAIYQVQPTIIVAKPPCHQPFISCHLLFSPAGWPAVAFYLHTLSRLPRLFFLRRLSCFLLHCIILSL